MKNQNYFTLAAVVLLLGFGSPLHAQLVADGATATVNGTSTNIAGNLTIGTNGSFTTLAIINAGFVTNSGMGVVGQNASANTNQVIVEGVNSVWSMSGSLQIGTLGSYNRLIVTNGGKVINNAGGNMAFNGGVGNSAIVTGTNSVWTNSNNLNIGNTGGLNQLVVTNGGLVGVGSSLNVGNVGSSNQLLVASGGLVISSSGALGAGGGGSSTRFNLAVITDPGSRWTLGSSLAVGPSGSFNKLFVTNGAKIFSSGAYVGANSIQSGIGRTNLAFISDPGSTWTNTSTSAVGNSGSFNQLVISNGAVMCNTSGRHTLGFHSGSTNNSMLVTGTNSIFSMLGALTRFDVGLSGSFNQLSVRDGGAVATDTGDIGFNASSSNNVVLVADPGSLWTNSLDIYVGESGVLSLLVVSNNGTVKANGLVLGLNATSSNNLVMLSGGNLIVTNSGGNSVTDVRRGLLVIDAGLFQTDTLLLTNFDGDINLNGGLTRVRQTTCTLPSTVRIGDNSRATLELVGGNTHTFASGLRINNGGVLAGNGTITGNLTNQAGGTLSPGTSIGKFTVNGTLNLLAGSTNIFEINKASLTNDSLVVTGAVAYGGTLIVTNLGGTLTNGDNFKLFTGASYSGTFSALVLPSLSPGLYWTNKLLIDGSIGIYLVPPRDFGVDVSHFQGETGVSQAGWNQMFTEGKRFAFIKATEGLSVLDAAMENNAARATAAGLRAGVYHFAHPELRPTTNGAIQEADYFMTYAGNLIGPGYLRPVLDLETGFGLTTAELTDWVIAFANEIVTHRGPGAAPIVYCSQSYANNELDSRLATYDLWLRTITAIDVSTNEPPIVSFPDPTGVFDNWSFWQYSDTGNSGGITPLDLNVCHSEFKLLDSFLIPAVGSPVAPSIVTEPQDRTVVVSNNASFTVTVSVGTSTPFSYQWRFNGTNIAGATASAFTRTNAQFVDAGDYTVVITNVAGSITSAVATLTVNAPTPPFEGVVLYSEDFDGYSSPSVVTSTGDTNGFKVFFNAVSGPVDFTALFGFDYSTVVSPTNIPVAPSTTNGTTKGLSLTVNKDGTAAIAAVNLYPLSQTFTGSYALKFDLWINHANNGTATEHTLFGVNHSGAITNRVGLTNSDGLFFAMDGDGGVSSGSTTLRDFAVFRGGGTNAIPSLLVTNTLVFGPEPLLGALFDNADAGISAFFPPQAIPGSTTAAGSAGLRWLSVEVRQLTNQITWLLDGVVIAQYTNTFDFTNGNILIGYNDAFASLGSTANFALFDNLRVETAVPDYDNDGLLDQWEVQYFGGLSANPALDSDGDGVSNLNELFAGTNPTNSASRFQLLSATRTNNDFLLTWSAVGGHSYVLQSQASSSGGLATNFTDLSPLISVGGTSETLTNYLHVSGATNSGGYYRVRLGP